MVRSPWTPGVVIDGHLEQAHPFLLPGVKSIFNARFVGYKLADTLAGIPRCFIHSWFLAVPTLTICVTGAKDFLDGAISDGHSTTWAID